MPTNSKDKNNFLSVDSVKTFILANVLHAIDHNLLNFKFSDIEIKVDIEYEGNKYMICVDCKEKEVVTLYFSIYADTQEDHMRMLMGSTMSVLDCLLALSEQTSSKPVLKIVK